MTQAIFNPVPLWLDIDGALLDGGYIFVGVAGADPQISPLPTFWDKALTLPTGPLRTRGGHIVRGANPANVFIAQDDFSIRSRNLSGAEVVYVSSIKTSGSQYQPLDDDLTAISEIATVAYGRNLLTLSSQSALRSATGIPDPLPLAGGTVAGNINRLGAGVHLYHADTALGSGRVFITASGAADPTSLPGDIWLEKI